MLLNRKWSRNPWIVLVAFWLGLFLAWRARLYGMDGFVIWTLLLTMSIIALIRMIWHGGGPYGQHDILPDRIRRWMLDEPDDRSHYLQ